MQDDFSKRPVLTLPTVPLMDPKAYKKAPAVTEPNVNNFYAYLKGKNVIIIGPAGYYQEPKNLNEYDVVVRINHGYTDKARTDVLYLNAHFTQAGNAEKYSKEITTKYKKINWFIFKYSHGFKAAQKLFPPGTKMLHPSSNQLLKWNKLVSRHVPQGERLKTLNEGMMAIFHLLESDLKTLTIRGFDFYESGYYQNYSPRYRGAMTPELIQKIVKDGSTGHDHQTQKICLAHLVKREPRLKIDSVLKRILDSSYPIDDKSTSRLPPISIVIPYKPNGHAHWQKMLNFQVERYKKVFPECQICIGENSETPFNRAKAKNEGFKQAKHDLVLFTDLDALFERDLLFSAAEALKGSYVMLAGKSMCLSQANTKRLLNIKPPVRNFYQQIEGTYVANFFILTKKEYVQEVKGFDERFIDWGGEDFAFSKALDICFGEPEQIEGRIFHLWHNTDEVSRINHLKALEGQGKTPTAELELKYRDLQTKEELYGLLTGIVQ